MSLHQMRENYASYNICDVTEFPVDLTYGTSIQAAHEHQSEK
jgi:hypothetical protein